MMERNLDNRVEVACPIYDHKFKKIVMDTFNLSFEDNVKGRQITAESSLEYKRNNKNQTALSLRHTNILKN